MMYLVPGMMYDTSKQWTRLGLCRGCHPIREKRAVRAVLIEDFLS